MWKRSKYSKKIFYALQKRFIFKIITLCYKKQFIVVFKSKLLQAQIIMLIVSDHIQYNFYYQRVVYGVKSNIGE